MKEYMPVMVAEYSRQNQDGGLRLTDDGYDFLCGKTRSTDFTRFLFQKI